MRVLALGGAGGMGSHACRIVAGLDGVDELVVADLDADRAAGLANELGPDVRSIGVDVTDAGSLASAMARSDIVMNTVGPFFRFGVPILTAALEAGCHYLDVCDDGEPTLEMLDMHDRAVRAGVTAIVGMGASPGISNLLAAVAVSELDADSAHGSVTGWNIEGAQPEPTDGPGVSAALVHGIEQMTGTIPVVRDRRIVQERPLRRIRVDYPGLGSRPAWTFGHPEPLTLVRSFPSLVSSVNAAHASRSFVVLMKAVRRAVDHRMVTAERAARALAWAERHMPAPKVSSLLDPRRLPPLFAHATGLHEGRSASVGVALCRAPGTTMGALTGIPLAVAVGLVARRELTRPGVFAPEAVIDPTTFFATLADQCPDRPLPDEMISTTRSWEQPSDDYRVSILGARRYTETAFAPASGERL